VWGKSLKIRVNLTIFVVELIHHSCLLWVQRVVVMVMMMMVLVLTQTFSVQFSRNFVNDVSSLAQISFSSFF
jgi:hypothetical protein